MKHKAVIWTGLIIVAILFVTFTANREEKDQKIRIGVIAPLSGVVADYGEEMRRGIQEVGVARASEVEFVFEDDQCDPKMAVSAFKKLVEFEKIQLIIGPGCGSSQEAIVPLLKNAGVMALVPSAASKTLYIASGGNFYNVQYSLEDESKFIAEEFMRRGYKKVALVAYQNAFSKTHADSFRANFRGDVVYDSAIGVDVTDISTEVAKIKATKPDVIYSPDISFFFAGGITKLVQFGVTAPVFSTYVAELPVVRSLVPNVFYSFPKDIAEGEGAVFGLAKQAAEILSAGAIKCSGDIACVRSDLSKLGFFDDSGVAKREMVLKQIRAGQPEVVTPK